MATVVHRLRIRSAERDAHSVESRVAARLGAAELAPAALPPGATLVVRRIDGLPVWRMDPRAVRPPADWQAAVSDRLDGLLRRAVRARRGQSWADAEAVLYYDDAEMLAAIARDWTEGKLSTSWQWACLFPRAELTDAMLRAWIQRPQCVPAAIERLDEVRCAEKFVRLLPDAVVEEVARAVVRVFALPEVLPVLNAVFGGTPLPRATKARQDDVSPMPVPVEADLAPEPAVLHGSTFVETAPIEDARPQFLLRLTRALRSSPRPRARVLAERLRVELLAPVAPESHRATVAIPVPPSKVDEPAQSLDAAQVFAAEPAQTVAEAPAEYSETVAAIEIPPPVEQATPVPAPAPRPARLPAIDGAVEVYTAFGGIFYLINLGIYLGYYGDFSTPDQPGIDLPLWDFLALVARELIGERLLEDPVWEFLESLGEGEEWDELEPAVVRIRKWFDQSFRSYERPAELAIEHGARVRLTETRLDVFLSLDELPIAVRLARLDRDPGWIPAAGRHIAFHFQ